MTAEIAILNKSAVALATDSAVTISSGNSHQKVFDTADKLFELSKKQPIGIMIYNGMQFSGIPIQDLIKEFRSNCNMFETISDASTSFLTFLNEIGRAAPETEKKAVIFNIVNPFLDLIDQRIGEAFRKAALQKRADEGSESKFMLDEVVETVVSVMERVTERFQMGNFFKATSTPRLLKVEKEAIVEFVAERFQYLPGEVQSRISACARTLVLSDRLSNSKTGVVIAGFGNRERFPTLISIELEGVIAGRLKFVQTSKCAIDRNGNRAFVRPFAQKEMVARFLYGLDDDIQREIVDFLQRNGRRYIEGDIRQG
ncbi:MAG: hypothetical protein GC186_10305 [Rhodobacteraceae bacterium]|nr:hypothetical protein [Paracoccaceae bacterium]